MLQVVYAKSRLEESELLLEDAALAGWGRNAFTSYPIEIQEGDVYADKMYRNDRWEARLRATQDYMNKAREAFKTEQKPSWPPPGRPPRNKQVKVVVPPETPAV